MQRTIFRVVGFLILMMTGIAAAAQTEAPADQTPPKPPDMVCFGYGPKWSVQFINGEARYLGMNQPDQTFLGDFYWVPEDKAWEWHRADGLAPMNGGYALSATIQKAACADPVRKRSYPYSSQVNLPQGDMVSGCCRKLRPGEAPVGKHGLTPTPDSGDSQSTTSSQAPSGTTQKTPKLQ
jgi:uncharacterized membrane protein